MESKLYLIDEQNEHEGETFGYIVRLTPKQFREIHARIEEIKEEDGYCSLEIKETTLTTDDVKLINAYSSNTYMDRLGYYELTYAEDKLASFDPTVFGYKGGGLCNLEIK